MNALKKKRAGYYMGRRSINDSAQNIQQVQLRVRIRMLLFILRQM